MYFSSNRHGGNYEIYRSAPDGVTDLIRLTFTSVNNYYAKESPDGSKIIWQGGDYGVSAEIMIADVSGINMTSLTNNSVHDGYPNFSPDGQKIIYEGWDGDPYPEIYSMNLDGTNKTQLTQLSGAYWNSAPVYDPTGQYIYFLAGFNADNHIVRMDENGSNLIDITAPNSFGIS